MSDKLGDKLDMGDKVGDMADIMGDMGDIWADIKPPCLRCSRMLSRQLSNSPSVKGEKGELGEKERNGRVAPIAPRYLMTGTC